MPSKVNVILFDYFTCKSQKKDQFTLKQRIPWDVCDRTLLCKHTHKLYPGVLSHTQNLHIALKKYIILKFLTA